MNKVSFFILNLLAYNFVSVFAMEVNLKLTNDYNMRQASDEDVQAVVDLINMQGYKDSDKIVVVPEQFRTAYIQSAIHAGRLFVACHGNEIIGYKKLFCITDEEECDDILSNELRIKGNLPVVCGSVSIPNLHLQDISSEKITKLFSLPATYIYNGADFTHPDHRGHGVNTHLTKYALHTVSKVVSMDIKNKKSNYVTIVYGLTQDNAGKENNVLDGRTHGIVKQFISCAQSIAQSSNCISPLTFLLSRHHAFKPSFDPKAKECRPLADEEAIPGYGCLIMCPLNQECIEHRLVAEGQS